MPFSNKTILQRWLKGSIDPEYNFIIII